MSTTDFPSATEAPAAAGARTGRVRLRTLVAIRWVAVAGQAAAILVVYLGLGFALPLAACLATVAASALVNLVATAAFAATTRLGDRGATLMLLYDVVQLAFLIGLTGGLHNPFALLFVVPVTISAATLSARSTALLCLAVLAAASVLAFVHAPLPWFPGGLAMPPLYTGGIWAALALGTPFLAVYVLRIAEDARRMSDALAATQSALARAHSLSALGALAAAAAHELGTPLGTIALVAGEMARDLPPDSPHAEDVRLLVEQARRCRDILGRLAREREGTTLQPLALTSVLEAVAAPHRRAGLEIAVSRGRIDGAEPVIAPTPELVHGIGNLVENATEFARTEVRVWAHWNETRLGVEIDDDGPGFDAGIFRWLGEPYVSGRADPDGLGLGLGVFIAKTLLERTGADIAFANRPGGGARVVIGWRRAHLEAERNAMAP